MLIGPDYDDLLRVVATALAEDIGAGDITSRLTIPGNKTGELVFAAREPLIACGTFVPKVVYAQLDKSLEVNVQIQEGDSAVAGAALVSVKGPAGILLTGERVALNLMQHLSGIAMLTRRYVEAVAGTKAVILDTRKTLPGLRLLEKYAVRAGGGQNHRLRLDDMVLIKDNHVAISGGIAAAIRKARAGTSLLIEVECDTLAQVREALTAGPDRILLDNMSCADMREAVSLSQGKIPMEASGGISLDNVAQVAATGVDFISIGKLTHSAPAMDIGADLILVG